MRTSFLLYADAYDSIRLLSLEQKGQILDAIFTYQRGEELPELDPVVAMAFSFIRRMFDRDNDKYAAKCEKAKASIRKRWDTNVYERKNTDTNHTDNDPVPDTDTVPDTVPDTKNINIKTPPTPRDWGQCVKGERGGSSAGRFTPPTVEQVSEYLTATGSTIDPEEFHAHYATAGWVRGKNTPIRDWKACVKTWETRRKQKLPPPDTSWHKYRVWSSRYLERRAVMHPDTPEATPELVDAGARVVAEWIAPGAYTEELLSRTVSWLLEDHKRCARVPSLANLSDTFARWGQVATWASNGARGVDVEAEND